MKACFSKFARSRIVSIWAVAVGLILWGAAAGPATAQTDSSAQEPKEEQQKQEKAAPAAAQVQSGEGLKLGLYEGRSEIEIGYRWVSKVAGNKGMYRSMVNLGEGPKLLRSNIVLRGKEGAGLFDRFDLSMNSWGGDPYNTMRLSFGRMDLYEFRADYRNLNYYNFIPTYSNPLLGNGSLLGQHSLAVSYRTTEVHLKLFPNSKIRPYVAYGRGSGFGPGYTTYSVTGNEFLLNTRWRYASDEYRGGVEVSLPRLVLAVEQGYQLLRNDSAVANTTDKTGNHPVPFIGQPVTLSSLERGYHDRTGIPVTKLLGKFAPLENLNVTGRYIYSMADLESDMGEISRGNLVSLENRLIYQAAADAFGGRAKRPSHNASLQIGYSPFSRVTVSNEFSSRNYHVSGSALLASTFLNVRPLSGLVSNQVSVKRVLDSLLTYDQTRVQSEIECELGLGFAARGGHRYTYVETVLKDTQDGEKDLRGANFTRQTGLAGLVFRRGRWLHLALDYERNQTDAALTRMDLLNYDQLKFDWRLGMANKFSTSGRVAFLRNRNSQKELDLRSHNRSYTVAFNYEPSERFSLSLDYERSNIYSDVAIIIPQTLSADRSLFDERGHGIGGSLGIGLYRGARVDFGYHGVSNVGSFPLNYHQPFASISIPMHKRVAFKTYWQYHGYNEKGSSLQDYRTHLVTYSLAYAY